MRRNGKWAGEPIGRPENKERCVVAVSDGWIYHQCSRKRGYGKDELFCKQHSKKEKVYVPEEEE